VGLAHIWLWSWSIAPIGAESQTSLPCHWYWSGFLQLQHQFVPPRCWGKVAQLGMKTKQKKTKQKYSELTVFVFYIMNHFLT
jgi:hypothetical protein